DYYCQSYDRRGYQVF
nr:immunoglobulin light chain junction region [Macaca mulatta]MOW02636.1 immunoglobulin light chain junction region [Macaca mulatta]MOW02867.1 immunoglobulin light chain junction region [Macaca mulatta]MOW02928.1 immunoglobulin light chain junction region [Macaca mulatta]MOW03018.1 immunoglobulin light chain junction region [Macaca mulatta]